MDKGVKKGRRERYISKGYRRGDVKVRQGGVEEGWRSRGLWRGEVSEDKVGGRGKGIIRCRG